MQKPNIYNLQGPAGAISINTSDTIARQLAMLFEGECLGYPIEQVATKYNYSRPRYYQLLYSFKQHGSRGLAPKKKGPKSNTVRTDNVVSQIVRHKFLDPDANSDVIAQKMRQCGIRISKRSVERTITQYGLQKKTVRISTIRKTSDNRG